MRLEAIRRFIEQFYVHLMRDDSGNTDRYLNIPNIQKHLKSQCWFLITLVFPCGPQLDLQERKALNNACLQK